MGLRVTLNARFDQGGITENLPLSFDELLNAAEMAKKTGTVGTSNAVVDDDNISTLGFVILVNTDSADNLLAGDDGTNYPIEISPGKFAAFEINGASLNVKGAAAGVTYMALLFEAFA